MFLSRPYLDLISHILAGRMLLAITQDKQHPISIQQKYTLGYCWGQNEKSHSIQPSKSMYYLNIQDMIVISPNPEYRYINFKVRIRTWWDNSECSIFRQNRVLFEIWYSMVDFSELLRVVPYFHVKMSTMLQILMMIITKLGIPLRNLIFWEGVIFTLWQPSGGDGILIRILNWKFKMFINH